MNLRSIAIFEHYRNAYQNASMAHKINQANDMEWGSLEGVLRSLQ